MKSLVEIGMNDQDQPVLKFTHCQDSVTLEQQLLGALVRQIARKGIVLVKTKTHSNSEEKIFWDYEIRAKTDTDETD
jgi:hypothetical protein